jgi:hypothetical protein
MLRTRSRIALAAATLAGAALLAPASPAAATRTPCTAEYRCDVLRQYFSDSTKTYLVGEYENGFCGQVNWGQVTAYVERVLIHC